MPILVSIDVRNKEPHHAQTSPHPSGLAMAHRPSDSTALHLIAVPLLIIASLLIISGVLSLNLADISIGIIAVFASLGLLHHAH